MMNSPIPAGTRVKFPKGALCFDPNTQTEEIIQGDTICTSLGDSWFLTTINGYTNREVKVFQSPEAEILKK